MALRDANDLLHGHEERADVCIVGGGPAGISIALALAGSSLSVVLLESGGEGEEERPKQLNQGRNTGLPYYDLDHTRHRAFGGASQRWAGWSRPMDRSDFEHRDWVPMTGWPISYDDLLPYYREAAELCELETLDSSDRTDDLPAVYRPPFTGGDVEVATWEGSPPTKFGSRYRADIDEAPNIRAYTHATVTEVLTADGSRASGVRVATETGVVFAVEAPVVILCPGAIETARLLLSSRDAHSDGLGNQHDLVGRYFMEHPHLVTAKLLRLPPDVTNREFVPGIDAGIAGTRDRLAIQRPSGSRKVAYVIAEERRAHERLLNFSTHLRTASKVNREESKTYQAFKLVVNNLRSPGELATQVRSGSLPEGSAEQIGYLVRGMPEVAQVVFQEALKRPDELALYTQCEQEPNPHSRVTLDASEVDANGMPRLELDWRLTRADKESVMKCHDILGDQFLASGLGVLLPEPAFLSADGDWGPGLRGGHHHMGTARMAHDPRHGVVDANCRVHGVDGLYVGDSAVFATGGYANPLITTVAVARRLAAHVRSVAG